jgi:hypothetical protein
MGTSLTRKIIFTIIGLLISAFVLLSIFDPGGGDHSTWTTLPSFIAGIILISLGYTRRITLWYIFFTLFSLIPLDIGKALAHTGRYPPTFLTVMIFATLLIFIFFITYSLGIYKEPLTTKKEIILVVVFLLLMPTTTYFVGFVNGKSVQYASKIERINFILPASFSSMDQCNTRHVLEESGFCYGYFASEKNDMSLCNKFIDDNVDPLLNRNYIYANCVTGFSVYQNNPTMCSDLTGGAFKSKCLFHYFIAKNQIDNCRAIENEYWNKDCLEYNPPWYVKKYAEIVYSEKFK